MKITKIKIENYKGFNDSGEVSLTDGFNIVVGQNNSGKTAFLEAATANFHGNHNRNPKKSIRETANSTPSFVQISILTNGADIYRRILNGERFIFPAPDQLQQKLSFSNIQYHYPALEKHFKTLWENGNFSLEIELKAESGEAAKIKSVTGPVKFYDAKRDFVEVSSENGQTLDFHASGYRDDLASWIGWRDVAEEFIRGIYHFEAERVDLSWSPLGQSSILEADGQNLAEVLNTLQGRDPQTFLEYNSYISRIFPSIRWVSVVNENSNLNEKTNELNHNLEILIWPSNGHTDRADLSVPMAECGTGVGQVLAILYVAITSKESKFIIIDEPNSFLHPGATRKLIELLKRDFGRHQYLISTHSAEVIRSADPTSLTLVKWTPYGSVAEQLTGDKVHILQAALSDIGVKISDVFGADNIIWVEGPTEETAVHEILTQLVTPPVLNTSVIPVVSTGDFESKKLPLSKILDIYQKFSKSNALVPPSIAFIFDSEGRKESEIQDAVRRGKGLIHFLPRRMFENYLIDSEAIDAVLKLYGEPHGYSGSAELIERWIREHGTKPEYVASTVVAAVFSTEWFETVHAGNLLKRIFQHFMENKLEFSKTSHSTAICHWLIENKPEFLRGLTTFLENAIKPTN